MYGIGRLGINCLPFPIFITLNSLGVNFNLFTCAVYVYCRYIWVNMYVQIFLNSKWIYAILLLVFVFHLIFYLINDVTLPHTF